MICAVQVTVLCLACINMTMLFTDKWHTYKTQECSAQSCRYAGVASAGDDKAKHVADL